MTYISASRFSRFSPFLERVFDAGGKVDAPIESCHARDTWTMTYDICVGDNGERRKEVVEAQGKPTFYPIGENLFVHLIRLPSLSKGFQFPSCPRRQSFLSPNDPVRQSAGLLSKPVHPVREQASYTTTQQHHKSHRPTIKYQ